MWAELNALIVRNRGNPDAYAVFDFDNTTAIGDISNVCQWRMLETLAFKADFAAALKSGIPAGYHSRVDAMAKLLPSLKSLNESVRVETDAWRVLATGYWTLYRDLLNECGTDVGYPWIGHLFAGYTSMEYQAFAKSAAQQMLARKSGLWQVPYVPDRFPRGFALTPEARDLFRALREAGITPYIVSASNRELVLGMLDPVFGLEVAPDCAFGYRLRQDAAGRYLPSYDESWTRPQAHGKVTIIRTQIAPRHHGAEPVLTAGDSMGDYNMFTEFPKLQAALIYNRNPKAGPLADLIRNAPGDRPRLLVQGRDTASGCLIPSHRSQELS